jgi:transcriptional regulator with XRE-family HTH domain
LGELRNNKGWTQFDIAERVGIDRKHLAELETGKIEICLRALDLVAQTIGLELYELVKFRSKGK